MPTTQELHYTFDMRGATVATLTPINVSYPPRQTAGTFDEDVTSGFNLNIPNGLDFSPSQAASQAWSDLIAEKHLSILSLFPGFSNIAFDDLTDTTGFDMATASGVMAGARGTFSLGDTGSGSTITTNTVALSGTPAQVAIWVETVMYVPEIGVAGATPAGYSNPKTGRFQRVLRPYGTSTTFLQFDVSFNNGVSYNNDVSPQEFFNIPLVDQGSNFKLRISRRVVASPTGRVGLAGWALVY
jgi:hypothetical protein